MFLKINLGADMLFSNRGEKVSMGHFKEIEIGFINLFGPIWGRSIKVNKNMNYP